MANVIGPDVSFYQDDPQTPTGIDFVKMAATAKFVIIRAGQNLWVDPDFKLNWREAKLAKLPRGSYWFYDSRVEPKQQAELWVQQFGGDLGELPLFADLEEAYGGIYKGWRNWYTFLERLKQLVGGHEIGIYTAYYYWRDNAPSALLNPSGLAYFHQFPLWIANYGVNQPLIPKPWGSTEWLFWQYTEAGDGHLYGVESLGIDLNYFNGDEQAFKARFKIPDELPPPPPPDDEGTPTGRMYKVTASALKVREGPGLGYNSIGLLYLDEIVEEIGSIPDRTWLRVRRLDGGLRGWSFAQYLQPQQTPPPPPPPPPPDDGTPTGKMYRVTASGLKVRAGPGLEFNQVGLLSFGDIVEEIGSNADRTWLRVRRSSDGLSGWSSAAYLQSVDAPPPPPPPPPPDTEVKNWYRVNLNFLPIRENPNSNSRILGTFGQDDTVGAIDDTSNTTWVRILRLDGLTGWCEKKYLGLRGSVRPSSYRQKIFNGVSYTRRDLTDPRNIVVHALGIGLQTQGMGFLVTPPTTDDGILCTRKTSKFVQEFKMHIAINGDGWRYLTPPPIVCTEGDAVRVNGYAVSQGNVYSPKKTADPIVYISQRNQVTINEPKGQVVNAVSGDRLVVQNGQMVKNLAAVVPNPRTALGLNKTGRYMTLVVVDGREEGASEGMTFPELANLMISFGCHIAANMDGGGSSTMVIRGIDGQPRVINTPSDMGVPGQERAVANHLGISLQNP